MVIINFLTLLIINYVGTNFFSQRFSNISKAFLFVILWLTMTIINIKGINIYTPFILIMIYGAYIFIPFQGDNTLKILILVFFCLSMSISEFVSACLLSLVQPITKYNFLYTLALYLTMIILFLESKGFVHVAKMFLNYFSSNFFWSILVLPFFSYILVLGINRSFNILVNNKLNLIYCLFLVIGIYSANFIMLNHYIKLLKSTKIEYELKLEKQQNTNLNLKFEYLNHYYLKKFSFLHNMLHNFNKLSILNREKRYAELDLELKEVSKQVYKEFKLLYSSSKALGTILNENMEFIVKNEIEIINKLDDNLSFLSYNDQLFFFSELLSCCLNSFVPSSKIKPIIIIKSKIINNYLLLKVGCNYKIDKHLFETFQKQIANMPSFFSLRKEYNEDLSLDYIMITLRYQL